MIRVLGSLFCFWIAFNFERLIGEVKRNFRKFLEILEVFFGGMVVGLEGPVVLGV
jgi:hypothetical protein